MWSGGEHKSNVLVDASHNNEQAGNQSLVDLPGTCARHGFGSREFAKFQPDIQTQTSKILQNRTSLMLESY